MDTKLSETMAALARGEKPNCPWCGAKMTSERLDIGFVTWGCYSEIGINDGSVRREYDCYERELAALREENAEMKAIIADIDNTGGHQVTGGEA